MLRFLLKCASSFHPRHRPQTPSEISTCPKSRPSSRAHTPTSRSYDRRPSSRHCTVWFATSCLALLVARSPAAVPLSAQSRLAMRIGINPTTMVSPSRTRVTLSISIEPVGEGEDDEPPHATCVVEFHAPPPFSTRGLWLGVGSVCIGGRGAIWLPKATAKVTTATPTTSFLATHRPRRRLNRITFVMMTGDHRTMARVWQWLSGGWAVGGSFAVVGVTRNFIAGDLRPSSYIGGKHLIIVDFSLSVVSISALGLYLIQHFQQSECVIFRCSLYGFIVYREAPCS